MVETVDTSVTPPEDNGPSEGSDAWCLVEANKRKREENAAKITAPAEEKIRQFYVSMSFKELLDDDAPTLNLYKTHKEFIVQLLALSEGDVHLIPTSKADKDAAKAETKTPILSADAFPPNDKTHRLFFHRQVHRNETTKRTTIKIQHSVLMKESVYTVKQKLMEHLKKNNLWMFGGELDDVETNGIGWLLAAHANMTYRPSLAAHLNMMVSKTDPTTLAELIGKHGKPEDTTTLPTLFLNPHMQNFGIAPSRVSTNAVTISCVKSRARLMKDLISLIPDAEMPFLFIPMGTATILSVEEYKKFIVLNNDRQNELQGITVEGFTKYLFSCTLCCDNGAEMTVEKFFLGQTSIVSIQETNKTAESGRFIFVVKKSQYPDAKNIIEKFCSTTFDIIYPDQTDKDDYRVSVGSLPHLFDTAPAGGAVSNHIARLGAILKNEESARGKSFPSAAGTWAQKVAPRLVFDKNVDFPKLSSNTNTTASVQTTSKASVQNSVSTTNSASTIAHNGGASTSRTVISHDVSSVLTEMKSFVSLQSAQFEKMIERQDQLAREAAASAKEAAKDQRDFMERMLNMITDMTKSQNERYRHPYYNPSTRSPSRKDWDRSKSTMWSSRNPEARYAESAVQREIDEMEEADAEDYAASQVHSSHYNSHDDDSDDYLSAADDIGVPPTSLYSPKIKVRRPPHVNLLATGTHPSSARPSFSHGARTTTKPSKTTKTTNEVTPPSTDNIDHEHTDTDKLDLDQMQITPTKTTILRTLAGPGPSSVSSAPPEKARFRSPGTTPTQQSKLQRTGNSPQRPTTEDTIARKLDYQSTDATEPEATAAPNPSSTNDPQQQ